MTITTLSSAQTQSVRRLDVKLHWLQSIDANTAEAIIQLVNSTVEDGGTLGFSQPLTTEQATGFIINLEDRIHQAETHALLGTLDDEPACFVLMTQSSMPNCKHIAELTKGVVHPKCRGRGVVPQAFTAIVNRARQVGIDMLTLDVREGTRAHQLWSNLGFESFGVLNDYARVNGTSHRGHYMVQRVEDLAIRLCIA